MRLAYYAGASTAAAAACLVKAFHQRPNFYSATVYLSQSNACLLILTNLLLILACSFIYGLQRLLYGPLRPIEIEQLSEKAWYAVLDTLLAMPSFREDVGGWLLTMFVLLMAGKVWSWIGEGRVDILEQQPPANPRLFHARLATSLVTSVAFDLYMLNYCIETVMADPRPGMMVIFTFEFAVLSVFSVFTFSRYLLSVVESRIQKRQLKDALEARKNEILAERAASQTEGGEVSNAPIDVDENEVDVPGWEEKRRYLFALEVINDFVKLMIYIVFFTVSITFNGLPMHIMRDVYMTFASFSKRVTDYIAYRKATSDMNTRYPDATTEEIRGDACIVCRENMEAWEQPPEAAGGQAPATNTRRDEGLRAKKLPCGHILHLRCLKAWLERQQVCPTCRRPVVVPGVETQPAAPAAGVNPAGGGAGGAAAAAPRPPQNRARIFNLGPVRIGFLNGRGDQIQNILQQMRDQGQQQAAPAQPNPAQPGVQVPAPAPSSTQTPNNIPSPNTILPSPTTNASTQVQMMQIEQRLMQDAHNLSIDQRQLHTLRAMEAELSRLRALQIPLLPPAGTTTSVQRQMTSIDYTRSIDELRGSMTQQIQAGDSSLPLGLTLPEGWSITPLTRTQPRTNVTVTNPSSMGPTDPNGSPLFIPTALANGTTSQQINHTDQSATQAPNILLTPTSAVPSGSGDNSSRPRSDAESSTTAGPIDANTISAEQHDQGGSSAPSAWGSNGWGFDDKSESTDQQNEEIGSSASANGISQDVTNGQTRYDGKGKGRAVEMEEVSDPES